MNDKEVSCITYAW